MGGYAPLGCRTWGGGNMFFDMIFEMTNDFGVNLSKATVHAGFKPTICACLRVHIVT